MESVDLRSFTEQAQGGEWDRIAAMLIDRFEILRRGGADFGAIASNTPHRGINFFHISSTEIIVVVFHAYRFSASSRRRVTMRCS